MTAVDERDDVCVRPCTSSSATSDFVCGVWSTGLLLFLDLAAEEGDGDPGVAVVIVRESQEQGSISGAARGGA